MPRGRPTAQPSRGNRCRPARGGRVERGRRYADVIRHAQTKAERLNDTNRPSPTRTCVGCRRRDAAAELLRVVVAPGTTAVVPDPRRRAPGRGAWVHPVLECVENAQRRRAFARALRVTGAADAAAVQDYVAPPREMQSNG